MKIRAFCLSMIAGLLVVSFSFSEAVADSSVIPSRTIHLVYDDSGSMFNLGTRDAPNYVDTWCQAKYAMEVVASMLGEKDTLKVYYMSDYDRGKNIDSPPRLILNGSKNPQEIENNVRRIHDTITEFGNTPFAAVKKAHRDFKLSTADENWLVVLTDGEFEEGRMTSDQVSQYFSEVVSEHKIKVIMLGMGAKAQSIASDAENGIYFEQANTSKDVLNKLTMVCNRIFQRNALPEVKPDQIYFGLPMKELIVFAQGKEVRIGNLTGEDGTVYSPTSNIHAQYTEKSKAALKLPNPDSIVEDSSLNGYVATFDTVLEAGTYKMDVTGADSVQVYYKPNVKVALSMFDENDVDVTKDERIVNGNYRIEFNMVNAKNGNVIDDLSLLGTIDFNAQFMNSGKLVKLDKKTLNVKAGQMQVDVTANFLDYNYVEDKLEYTIFFSNELVWQFDSKPVYMLEDDGFANANEPMTVKVQMKEQDGSLVDLTPAQWKAMPIPTVTQPKDEFTPEDEQAKLEAFDVRKTDEIGKFEIRPKISAEMVSRTPWHIKSMPILIRGSFNMPDHSSAKGSFKTEMDIEDKTSACKRIMDFFKKWWFIIVPAFLALLILALYGPKNKFHGIPGKPLIEVKNKGKSEKKPGRFKREPLSVLIPLVSEKANITCTPLRDRVDNGRKSFRLEALKHGAIRIYGIETCVGKDMTIYSGKKFNFKEIRKEDTKKIQELKNYPFNRNMQITNHKVVSEDEIIDYVFHLDKKFTKK